jgi:WD40 repeat protein
MDFTKSSLSWTLPWDADWVTSVCVLGTTRRVVAGNNLGQILVWDLPDKPGAPAPMPARRLDGHTNTVTRLVCTADGKTLISASLDHTIRYWDMQAAAAGSDTVALNARTIADLKRRSASKLPALIEAKVEIQQAARVLAGHGDWINGLVLSRDEKLLVSADDAGVVIVWDRAAGKELRRWQVKGWTYALALSPDSKQALVSERKPLVFDSGRHAGVRLWDATTGKEQFDLAAEFKGAYIAAAAYSPDGKLLALGRGGETSGLEGKVTLVNPATGKKVKELTPGHQYGATDLQFHPDGKHLASSGRDTVVKIWDTATGKQVTELGKPRGGQFKDWLHAVCFAPDGRLLAAADMAGAVLVWTFEG